MIFPLDQNIAITGRAESGKSGIARLIVEANLAAGHRVCVIAPRDDWWGLRLSRGGRKPSGLNPILFGGSRADISMAPDSGAIMAELVAEKSISTVLATSHLSTTARCRWFSDFLNALVRMNRDPLRLVIDDFEMFMVGIGGKYDATTDALRNLMKTGGNGISTVLITRFPERLAEIVRADPKTFILTRCADPSAISRSCRLVGYTVDAEGDETLPDILPNLLCGQAVICEPATAHVIRDFGQPQTLTYVVRSSNDAILPRAINTTKVKQWITAIASERAPVKNAPVDHQQLRGVVEIAAARISAQRSGADIGFEKCRTAVVDYLEQRGIQVEGLAEAIDRAKEALPNALIEQDEPGLRPETLEYRAKRMERLSWVLSDGEKRVLTAVMQAPACTANTAALIAGMQQSSGEFIAAVGLLRRRKLLMPGFPLVPTVAGVETLAHLGDFELRPLGKELVDWWSEKLAPLDRSVFRILLQHRVNGSMSAFEIQQTCRAAGVTGDIRAVLARLHEIGIVRGGLKSRMTVAQAFGSEAPPTDVTASE